MMNSMLPETTGITRMRRVATGALAAVFCGMIGFRFLEVGHPVFGFFRAFCEAATVGAVADWFAVVALFRHPLGIPTPHTAVLPNNKGRVAESLGRFVVGSFLTEEHLGPRLRETDYAKFAADWLDGHADFLTDRAVDYFPRILEGLSDEKISALLAERIKTVVREVPLGPVVSNSLSVIIQRGRDREIYASLLSSAEDLIVSHREIIERKIREEIPLPVELLRNVPGLHLLEPALGQLKDSLASSVARRTIEKIQEVLAEAESDPHHVLWSTFTEKVHLFVDQLKNSPEMARKIQGMQKTMAASSLPDDLAASTWGELKRYLLRDCASQNSAVRARIREGIQAIVTYLSKDESGRQNLNTFFGRQILESVLAARPSVQAFISETVRKWDSEEMTTRIEATVGRDLQFIRLNGTIIGGLVGLLVHTGYVLLGR